MQNYYDELIARLNDRRQQLSRSDYETAAAQLGIQIEAIEHERDQWLASLREQTNFLRGVARDSLDQPQDRKATAISMPM